MLYKIILLDTCQKDVPYVNDYKILGDNKKEQNERIKKEQFIQFLA